MSLAITLRADEVLPVLKVNDQVYSNATVFKVTATDIYFSSSQGSGNAKLANLDPELQKHFHYVAPAAAPNAPAATPAVLDTQKTAFPVWLIKPVLAGTAVLLALVFIILYYRQRSIVSGQPRTSGLAVVSLVFGILGLVLCLAPLLAIPGVICAHMARRRINNSDGMVEGNGLAIAGMATNYIGLGLCLVLLTLAVAIVIPNFEKASEAARQNYLKAITAAMQSRREAYTTATTTIPNHGNTIYQVSLTVFVAEMRKIDVSACPNDFRAAWNGYLNLVEDRERKNPAYGYTALGSANAGHGQWDIPLDNEGMEFINAAGRLNDAVEKYKPKSP